MDAITPKLGSNASPFASSTDRGTLGIAMGNSRQYANNISFPNGFDFIGPAGSNLTNIDDALINTIGYIAVGNNTSNTGGNGQGANHPQSGQTVTDDVPQPAYLTTMVDSTFNPLLQGDDVNHAKFCRRIDSFDYLADKKIKFKTTFGLDFVLTLFSTSALFNAPTTSPL